MIEWWQKVSTPVGISVTNGWSDVPFLNVAGPTHLTISCGISIDLETGEVTIPEGLDLTEASRAFWDAVQQTRSAT